MASNFKSLSCDVLVLGGGNAGFSAALAAAQSNIGKVILIDRCPLEWAGGNSYFTAGAFRISHGGLPDILPIVSNVDDKTAKVIDLDPYTNAHFLADMARITNKQYDRKLGKILADSSNESIKWLAENGLKFHLSFNRQAFKVDHRFKFFGGLCLKTVGGGRGLMEFHHRLAKVHDIEVYYSTTAKEIRTNPVTGAFTSLLASQNDTPLVIEGKAIVLAAGGFEANSQMRSEHMGSEWSLAHVRGTPYNTGDVLILAIRDLFARTAGQWSGCHSVAWDANSAVETGDRDISNEFTKSGYPLGITLNLNGERFFDEGADLRNYTYAKFGRAILRQPKGMAFQVWDQKGIPWLRSEEYREERVERIWGLTIAELASKCVSKGLENPSTFIQTIKDYNVAAYAHHSANPDLRFDPAVLDSLSTQFSSTSLKIPKSNWALPIDDGPFMAVKVACGITFTFGGLAVDPETTGVISDLTGECIPGVFCAGEMLGGLFWDNYPGGSGLTAGVVFGRIAGRKAAEVARRTVKTRDGDGAQELGSRE